LRKNQSRSGMTLQLKFNHRPQTDDITLLLIENSGAPA
jgi:hypothetical protein